MARATSSNRVPQDTTSSKAVFTNVSREPDPPDTEPVIETDGLRMRYGSTEVLHGVDLRIRQGEVACLLGPNGAGKTTTIEILEGLRKRSAGRVRVLGTDPGGGGEAWRARMGVVLQSWRDHRQWRVRELLEHLGRYYVPFGTPHRPRPYDPDELLARVGLAAKANTALTKISGGQRRRLDVAIGLVGRPELLFLDEPTVGFDPEARQEFHELVAQLSDLEDTTIVLTTHDLDEAEKLAHRILILLGGAIVADGTPAQLAAQIQGRAEVRFTRGGEQYAHAVEDATGFVHELFAQHGAAIGDLEVRRPRLEDAYLSMVREFESGRHTAEPSTRKEAGRWTPA